MTGRGPLVLATAVVLATAAAASGQELAASFDALAGRIEVGQPIWVTDASGREIHGRLERLSSDGLVVRTDGLQTFAASDVRRVRARFRDPLKNGTLIGLGIGGGMASVWCVSAIADDSGTVNPRVECAEGVIVFPALGALIGLAVDAVIPGRVRVLYEAAVREGGPPASLIVRPLVSPHVHGVAVSFVF